MSLLLVAASPAGAETIVVGAGGDLQAALNRAAPGDVILLQEGAEFVGNFVLPVKPAGTPIVVRSSAPDSLLPAAGQRLALGHLPLLARIRSANTAPALATAAGTAGWRLQYLEFGPNQNGTGDVLQIGDGSQAQNTLAAVPRGIHLSHVYVHGDPLLGQKRCIALNAADVTIRDSRIADCKAVGQDSQAIGGWNGPGPYVIENNYIEGAGENFLLGGSDPAIPYLVADGVTFRRNHVTRPMAWRSPILATPGAVTAGAEAGGTLPAGTYGYRVMARGPVGQGNTGRSTASATVTATLTSTGSVRIRWTPVTGATEYRVYGRTAGGENVYWRTTGAEFVDTGGAGLAEAVPTSPGTVWQVKNLFELKNARNVVVEDNIFENHWKEAQPGYAIVLTPRNSGGSCTWCVVEHVRFEFNLVRNVAAGFNILGYDVASTPSLQTHDITIRHNVFHDVVRTLGGNAWFALIGDEPRDLLIDHNTFDGNGSTFVYTYGGSSTSPRTITGAQFTNNATRHGSYGMGGSYFSYGLGILDNYYPGHVFTANYLAGGSASRYPVGNLFTGLFEDQFTDAAAGDFTLRSGSVLAGAGTGGTDIGADAARLAERVAGVVAGTMPGVATPPVAAFTASCSGLTCTFTDASSDADGALSAWSWTFGDGASSADANPTHTYAAGGTYVITLQVTDASGLTASQTATVTVGATNALPEARILAACDGLVCTFTDASVDSDGTVVSRVWRFEDGTTASGVTEPRRFAAPGTYAVSLEVVDDRGGAARVTESVTVTRIVYVASMTGTVSSSRNAWAADVTVTIHDQFGAPAAGVLVTAAWTGATKKTGTCTTGSAGQCTLSSGTLTAKRTSVTTTVTGLSAEDAVHRPTLDVVTSLTQIKP